MLFFCECSHYPLQYLILIRTLGFSMVSNLIMQYVKKFFFDLLTSFRVTNIS